MVLLAAGVGLVIGALAAALWVRSRLAAQWGARLSEAQTEVQRGTARHTELIAERAALATRIEAIPALEKALSEARALSERLQAELRQGAADLAQALEKCKSLPKLEGEQQRLQGQLVELQEQTARQRALAAELKTALEDERRQSAEKIALLNEAREQLKHEFQNLAQRIFEEKSAKFADQNRVNLDGVINPLRQQLGDFKKRVEDVYDKEARDRAALQAEINLLKDLNQRIGKEALNLTRALKGDSKTRGNWGEVVLERVLEASGLQKGREYEVQVSAGDGQGKRYQPDVIVRLPEGKDVVIDAKVSLKDYEAFYNHEDPVEKEKSLKAHIDALRTHIRQLAAKDYTALEGVRSLDFVLMFIPVEAAFLAAVERDGAIFGEAFEKNIMLVSPSTLLVTLRTIQNIWRYEYQNRYALEIAKEGGALYDKFVGFVESLEEIGTQLERARSAYRNAHDRLSAGRGNLVRRAQKLKAMGVKAGKELPGRLIESAEENGAEEIDGGAEAEENSPIK
jgi:DNA recombination protein RmuC